jgi:hypothetical protein
MMTFKRGGGKTESNNIDRCFSEDGTLKSAKKH